MQDFHTSKENGGRCLVLGGNGFIGSHLVHALLAQGYHVRVFDRPNTTSLGQVSPEQVQYYYGDITSEADLSEAMQGCDTCFHLVSTVLPKNSNTDPVYDIESNLIGSVRMLNYAVKYGVKKIVFVSSGGTVYGVPQTVPISESHPQNPLCSYGIVKLAIEKYLELYHQLHGLDYRVLRLSNPFGEMQRVNSSQGAVAVFLSRAMQKKTVEIWGNGDVVRDYIHISDVVRAMLASLEYNGEEKVFNIAAGQGYSLNELLDVIEEVVGHPVERRYTEARSFDVPVSVLDISKATRELGWKPELTFIEGLQRMKYALETSL